MPDSPTPFPIAIPGRAAATEPPSSAFSQYTYDAVGNRKAVIDPEQNTTTWNYDELNRLTSEINQLGDSRSFEYDEYGNLVKRTDREGRVIQYQHDLLGLVEHENWLDEVGAVIWTISFSYDDTGVMLTASDANASLTYQPDGMGRIGSVAYDLAGLGFNVTLTQQYDIVGNRNRLETQIGGGADFVTGGQRRDSVAAMGISSPAGNLF